MAITFSEGKKLFKLDTQNTTYMIGLTKEGYVGHVYYGEKLNNAEGFYLLRTEEEPFTPETNDREKMRIPGCISDGISNRRNW